MRMNTLVAGTLFAIALPAHALDVELQPDDSIPESVDQEHQQRFAEIHNELSHLQADYIQENDELRERQEEVTDYMYDHMEDLGHTPREDIEALERVRDLLEDEDQDLVDDPNVLERGNQAQQSLMSAYEDLAASPDRSASVDAKLDELQQQVIDGLREDVPEAQELLEELEELDQERSEYAEETE